MEASVAIEVYAARLTDKKLDDFTWQHMGYVDIPDAMKDRDGIQS